MHISQHTIFFALIGVIIIGGIGVAITRVGEGEIVAPTESIVTDFQSCAAAGNPVMESYPRQCRHTDGRTFTEVITAPIMPDTPEPPLPTDCAPAGCSSQLCVPADVAHEIVTTCEWTPLYGCYQKATCERQESGQCGWTETPDFTACVENIAE